MVARLIITYFIIFGFVQGKKINNDSVKSFIVSRYQGDTSTVSSLISERFIYNHPPSIGLGIDVVYKNGAFEILSTVRQDSLNFFSIGDKIYEINNIKISKNSELPKGPIDSIHKIILTKKNDSTFIKIDVPLSEFSYKESKLSFLKSISLYSNSWYDFDVKSLDIFYQKNKAFVYYKWEGSKVKGGTAYIFYAMEVLIYDRKKEYINSIKTLWSKDTFMKQFSH
jgi:hypothetical protein